jgi:hypothetical protein
MRDEDSTTLTEKEMLLLSAYADEQCSFLSRLLAERLIKKNPDARLFISNLQQTSTLFQEHAPPREIAVDLWSKIDQRITAEERAELYLGRRQASLTRESSPLFERLFARPALFGGLSGAAVAALVLVFVSRPTKPGEILPVYTGGPVAAVNSSAFHQTGFSGTSPQQSTMEVDWMRGNGSLQLIQNPESKSAIIWVRKRNQLNATPARVVATPTIRILEREGIDVTPLSRSK